MRLTGSSMVTKHHPKPRYGCIRVSCPNCLILVFQAESDSYIDNACAQGSIYSDEMNPFDQACQIPLPMARALWVNKKKEDKYNGPQCAYLSTNSGCNSDTDKTFAMPFNLKEGGSGLSLRLAGSAHVICVKADALSLRSMLGLATCARGTKLGFDRLCNCMSGLIFVLNQMRDLSRVTDPDFRVIAMRDSPPFVPPRVNILTRTVQSQKSSVSLLRLVKPRSEHPRQQRRTGPVLYMPRALRRARPSLCMLRPNDSCSMCLIVDNSYITSFSYC